MDAALGFFGNHAEQILIWICIAFSFICVAFAWRWHKRRAAAGSRQQFVRGVLEAALARNAVFDIKMEDGGARSGLAAVLIGVADSGLALKAQGFVADEWNKKRVEVYFRDAQAQGQVHYVFHSTILRIDQAAGEISMAAPEHLRVEKKRHFVRVSPSQADILMIAIWPAEPGRRLPRANADMGQPVLSWKTGQRDEAVQLENISAGGMALRFQAPAGALPFNAEKGGQIICLLVYKPAPQSRTHAIFWSSGEIMNARQAGCAVALGLEFTNWAAQRQGETEIHWTHSSPWQGARPILKWVRELEGQGSRMEEQVGSRP